VNAQRNVLVIGLGYVGLPVAVAFGNKAKTIGFDISPTRIAGLQQNHDRTGEVTSADLAAADIHFIANIDQLKQADFHIILPDA